jgi:hypothetical protein
MKTHEEEIVKAIREELEKMKAPIIFLYFLLQI